ncbi:MULTISPECIES: DoxX family protein [Micrococcales]|uniref:DoxX family protein n=1 Tax=Micrococcales TaxID=85006 RepID=UPI00161D5040|nr:MULTISPECIES: DoxX family protein [Micrococcales]MBB5748914.1 ABC-type multidrug transport system permease subunit [Micrococcus sp. TA1]MCI2264944.1 DoxX family protein [Sediminivirga luteola]
MILTPDIWWLPALLAATLLFDAVASIRPPKFIRDCLDGVGFPREWWWTLIVIKTLAVTGLIVGIWVPGVGLAANVGVVVYFLCAAASHIMARFTGMSFWVNCLGMLVLSFIVLVLSFSVRGN